MRLNRIALGAALAAALVTVASAQTVQRSIVFDTTDVPTAVTTDIVTAQIDGGTVAQVAAGSLTCTANPQTGTPPPPPTTCKIMLSQADSTKIADGLPHTLVVGVTTPAGKTASGTGSYTAGGVTPGTPTTIRIEVVIKVP